MDGYFGLFVEDDAEGSLCLVVFEEVDDAAGEHFVADVWGGYQEAAFVEFILVHGEEDAVAEGAEGAEVPVGVCAKVTHTRSFFLPLCTSRALYTSSAFCTSCVPCPPVLQGGNGFIMLHGALLNA